LTAQSDGRVFFLIPWYGMTLLGTTDSDYHGDLGHVAVTTEETDYLLTEVNHYLKSAWTREDVVGSYAGVRVMQRSDERSLSAVSREWGLKTAGNGMHYSVGGKITSAREDAARMVDVVCGKLGVNSKCSTFNHPFPWAPRKDYPVWSASLIAQAVKLGIDQEAAMWLARRHGKRVSDVLNKVEIDTNLAKRITPSLPFIYADLLFCASEEMVVHLRDLLRRRMPILILSRFSESDLHEIATMVAPLMGWNENAMRLEVEACLQ
jgi:glycerol-3-phosphate dehydrogenase